MRNAREAPLQLAMVRSHLCKSGPAALIGRRRYDRAHAFPDLQSGWLAAPGLDEEVRDHVRVGVGDVASERVAQRLELISVGEPGL